MIRRLFGTLLLTFIAAYSHASEEATLKVARVGFLHGEVPPNAMFDAFKQGLEDGGYTEGRNLVIEQRWARGKFEDMPRLARELTNLEVDAILAGCTPCIEAAYNATRSIPIVSVSGNPVRMGFAQSYAHPGGNVTGFSLMLDELSIKRLQLLKNMAPKVSRVGFLWVTDNPFWKGIVEFMKQAAPELKIKLEIVDVSGPEEIPRALLALKKKRVNGLYICEDPMLRTVMGQINSFAAQQRIPAMYGGTDLGVLQNQESVRA